MTRSTDLDVIAPDDLSVTSDTIAPPTTPTITPPAPTLLTTDPDSPNDTIRQIMGHSGGFLSPTLVYPHFFDFTERDQDEKIYVVLRPHWFTNVSWILLALAMLSAPLILGIFNISFPFPTKFMFILSLFWYLATFSFSLEKFICWYFDIFVVTSKRVIDIGVVNLLSKKFGEAQLSMIQDINYKVSGVSQTLFNYGSVTIETAGENPDITFEHIAHPEKVLKVIQILSQKCSN